jgi:NitT/TauT family transport system substrate-binding protein
MEVKTQMKRLKSLSKIVPILALLPVLPSVPGFAAEKLEKIVLTSPFSPLAIPMAYIVENSLLKDLAQETELVVWNNPDQLRAMITNGEAHFVSVPSNVASIFYNKGVPLKLIRVSIWGVFYIISSDTTVHSLMDLKGQEIYVPFRGDQPDLMFQTVCQSQGLDPFKDFRIQYVSSPLDITMSLLAGQINHAFMIEPGAAQAIMKAKQKGMVFRRVINIQQEWGKATGGEGKFPNAGVVALPNILQNGRIVGAFSRAYDKAVQWTKSDPREAALLAAKHVKGVDAMAFEESLKYTILESVSGEDSRKELEMMFCSFMKLNPKSVGGKLPDEGFYY